MDRSIQLARRDLLKAGGIVLLAVAAPALGKRGAATKLNAWIVMGPGEMVKLVLGHAEMGQGITTTLPAILADELEVDFRRVELVAGDFDPAFRHPTYQWQFTGNSESISTYAEVVRAAGAAARTMLVEAAAIRTGIPAARLKARNGQVVGGPRPIGYGALAEAAASLRPPEKPVLKPKGERRSVSFPRIDIPEKVDGSAVFGIDVALPGMLSAAIAFAPSREGQLLTLDEAAIRAVGGVRAVVRLDHGYAVVADRWWTAQRALALGKPTWATGVDKDSEQLVAGYRAAMRDGPFRTVKIEGKAPAGSGTTIAHEFLSPFQAHATMEPMNCTVRLSAGKCEIWAPTQGMEMTHLVARQVTGLPDAAIEIHRTYLGGGFGRRLLGDFVKQAIVVARAVNAPVKLLYSREADFRGDFYRPAVLHRVAATLGKDGLPAAMVHRVVSPSMLLYGWPRGMFPDLADATQPVDPPEAYDLMPVEGVTEPLYELPHLQVDFHRYRTEMPVSVWRSTGHGPNNWALESMIDECARAVGSDPVAYRRRLLGHNPRSLRLLDALTEKAGLDRLPPSGQHRGIALAAGFGSQIAQAVFIEVDKDRAVRFRRVVSIVDVGEVLDPVIATRNIEGGVVWGLSALRTEIAFASGGTTAVNFDRFDPLHLWETPVIETHFVDGGGSPGGVGEIGPVPTLAAACNAICAATGIRLTELPIQRSGFSIA